MRNLTLAADRDEIEYVQLKVAKENCNANR